MKYTDWLAGWCEIEINGWFTENALTAIARENIELWDIYRVNERQIKAKVWLFDAKDAVEAVAGDASVSNETVISVKSKHGLIPFILRHKMRTGFATGFIVFIAAAVLMLSIIWSVDIKGIYEISRNEIIDELEKNGLFVGAFSMGHNLDDVRLALMRRFENIAYVTLNIDGSRLVVEIAEGKLPPERVDAKSPKNIVAKKDGVLITCEAYEGVMKVKPGKAVKEGDLLVSGVFTSNIIGYRLVRSSAEMMAYTKRTYTAFVPFFSVEYKKTGNITYKYSISLFNLAFDIPFTGINSYETCDTVTETFCLKAGANTVLPVSVSVHEIEEFEKYEFILSEEEARLLALSELDEQMRIDLFGIEIIDKKITFTTTESGVFCQIDCAVIEDIAQEVSIYTQVK